MAGALLLVALYLLPARGAALRGDDEWTFQFRGGIERIHQSVLSGIFDPLKVSLEHWRPQFLGDVHSYLVLYIFSGHPSQYRLYLVALTVIAAGLLGRLVWRLGASVPLAALTILLFAGAVQFRSYHDAMLGYYGSTQLALIFILLSLLALRRALIGAGWRWTVAATGLFALACMSSEWVYPLAATHLALAFAYRRGRAAITAALPILAIGLVLMAVGYLGRNGAATVDVGYGTSVSPRLVLSSYLTQLFPPIPGSYRLFYLSPIAYYYAPGYQPTPAELAAGLWRGLFVFAAVLGWAMWQRRRREAVESGAPVALTGSPRPPAGATGPAPARTGLVGRLVAVGAPLWLAPPLLIAVSGKYQAETTPGKGYVEVLVQSAGFTLIAVALLLTLLRAASRRGYGAMLLSALAAATLLGLGAGIDGFNNIRVVAEEQPVRHTRDLLETAARNGILDGVPQRSTLLLSAHDTGWTTGSWAYGGITGENVLYGDSRRDYDVRFAADDPALEPLNCPATPTYPPPSCAPPAPSSAWVRVRARPGGGVVIVSQLSRPTVATLEKQVTTSVYAYAEQSGTTTPKPPPLTGVTAKGRPWVSKSWPWTRVRSGTGWALYHATIPRASAPVAYSLGYPLSQIDFLGTMTTDQIVRIFGARGLLP